MRPSNIIPLPRPRALRPSPARLGYYLRVGHNNHKEVAQLLAEGERAYMGLIIEATNRTRHRELITDALRLGLDVVLDPKSHAAAFPGGYSDGMGNLPWGLGRPATLSDYRGTAGQRRAEEIAGFVVEGGFTAVVAPTHLLTGPDDPWFAADRAVAQRLRALLPSNTAIFYSLALPMQVLRDPTKRAALKEGLMGVHADALWLKVENFGSDATGEKVRAYVEAMAEFNTLGLPTVADHVGGLPGLALLGFDAAGGIAHGVMMLEGFRAAAWRRPPSDDARHFSPTPRVYLPNLDMLVAPALATALFEHSTRVRGQHVCRDPRCCMRGARDMLEHPTRHYLKSRAREVETISAAPAGQARMQAFMDGALRPRSDALAALAAVSLTNNQLAKVVHDRNRAVARLRTTLANLAEGFEPAAHARAPLSRAERQEL